MITLSSPCKIKPLRSMPVRKHCSRYSESTLPVKRRKLLPSRAQFKALGLVVDLTEFGNGSLQRPKVSEVDYIGFSSFLFGRRSSIALGEIGKRANGVSG